MSLTTAPSSSNQFANAEWLDQAAGYDEAQTGVARQTPVEVLQHIAEETQLKRVDVEAVFESLLQLISTQLGKEGSGEIRIPKIGLKIKRVRRKPTKKRDMVSPLTGDKVVIPPKPARDDIKLVALKPLKEVIDSSVECSE